jgi:hypothetical protein
LTRILEKRFNTVAMFNDREPEVGPKFITRIDHGADFRFPVDTADGLWYRVKPSTAREVFYLQSLPKGIRVLVPAEGDGLLVRGDSIPVK